MAVTVRPPPAARLVVQALERRAASAVVAFEGTAVGSADREGEHSERMRTTRGLRQKQLVPKL